MATIIKRLVKGTPLTNAEGDANLDAFNTEKLERNGSIPMTGNLVSPGIQSASEANGLQIFNENSDLVASFGMGNNQDIVIEGNINVGGQTGGSNIDLNGGDITARNIFLSGKIISNELGSQYGVSRDGEVFEGNGSVVSNKLVINMDIILRLVTVEGVFNVGNPVVGSESGVTATITKVHGNDIYVELADPDDEFVIGETITYATNTGVLSVVIDTSTFKVGHRVKVFGASVPGAPNPSATPAASATKVGTGTGFNYYYWISQFKLSDGKIAAARKITTSIVHKDAADFNTENNISLNLARTNVEYGLLVYRSVSDDITASRLINVLGPGQLGNGTSNITYIDYGGFSNTEWSTKDFGGAYQTTSGIVHFSVSAPAAIRRGWITDTVKSIDNRRQVTLDSEYTLNSGSSLQFVHDNTQGLQQFIDDQRELNIQGAQFPNGVYYTSKLYVPSNFEISGGGKQTIIKQIPWNFDYWDDNTYPNERGNIFTSLEDNPVNVFFTNISVDGNFVNNARYAEAAATYLINIPNGENVSFNNMSVTNSTGGGIYVYNTKYIKFQNSEVLNGGGSYLGQDLCPLYASLGEYLTVTNNLFENFVSPVDVSVTRIGTVVGNTVRNCGSGLLVYGSAHLLSSPNLLMGPDNEFLPTPDTMDSDYNAVNISLERGIDYISPSYLYIERGVVSYLGTTDRLDGVTPIPGTGVQLASDIRMLTKLNNSEMLKTDYTNVPSTSTPFINFISPDTGDYGRNNGYFQFKVLATAINELPTISDLITDNSGILVPNEQIMGLAYRILATTYTYTDLGERIAIASSAFSTTGSNKFITIALNSAETFASFVVGDSTKIFGHSSTPDINNVEGTVTEKIVDGLSRKIKIQLPSSTNLSGAVAGGATGYVTIRKTFIIAKGRVN
jgi:hypothetical protein